MRSRTFNLREDGKNGYTYGGKKKEFYMPKNKPTVVDVPAANYIAVRDQASHQKSVTIHGL